MSVVAASTFAPFSARVRSAIPARSRRASPSSTRRPVATARAAAAKHGASAVVVADINGKAAEAEARLRHKLDSPPGST